MSGLMQQAMYQLGVKQCKSSAYHPKSQGALERFHQTLKNMIRAYCTDTVMTGIREYIYSYSQQEKRS